MNNLKKIRGNRQQKQVAQDIGISNKLLSNIELEKRKPTLPVAYRLSKYYGVSIEELFPDLINKE